jgi:uncharacterized protein (DUF2252 family)
LEPEHIQTDPIQMPTPNVEVIPDNSPAEPARLAKVRPRLPRRQPAQIESARRPPKRALVVQHKVLSRIERRDHGKALRMKCPRSEHAKWDLRLRADDPMQLLKESNIDRIPGLIPVRYLRMAQSPFHFFRGSAIIQARDLARSAASGITVQACGDCHLMNFGGFATPERNLVFDINDFDETFPGPWEWDLKRLTVSVVLAARYRGFSKGDADDAVRAAVESYRERMSEFAEMTKLETWYSQIRVKDLRKYFQKDDVLLDRLEKAVKRGRTRTSEAIFPKLTEIVNGRVKIIDDPPFIFHHDQLKRRDWEAVQKNLMNQYTRTLQSHHRQLLDHYSYEDSAVKVVGVGSVGTRCFIILFLADGDDPLFLQCKEARRSVLEPPGRKSRFAHQGERVVTGQRLMQAASDIFLGWMKGPRRRDFYLRQLRDMKVAAEIETFDPHILSAYAAMCGWALARAQAKSGDPATVAGYLGSSERFDDALALYAEAYADQVEKDFGSFKKAIRSGRFPTDSDAVGKLKFAV